MSETGREAAVPAGLAEEARFGAEALPVGVQTLRSVFGLGLALGTLVFSVIALIALPFLGFAGQFTAVMSLLLPLAAFLTPAVIMPERALDSGTLARAEVHQVESLPGFSALRGA